jgi:hypothetical protein
MKTLRLTVLGRCCSTSRILKLGTGVPLLGKASVDSMRPNKVSFAGGEVQSRGLGLTFNNLSTDMLQLLSQAPNIQAATAELAAIRKEIEEMKKREDVDEVD